MQGLLGIGSGRPTTTSQMPPATTSVTRMTTSVPRRHFLPSAITALLWIALHIAACDGGGEVPSPYGKPCEIIGPEQCSAGCMPVISVPRFIATFQAGCVKSGVFFGCTPDENDPMWSDPERGSSLPWSVCTAKPGSYFLYCFARWEQVYWYYELGGYEQFCEDHCPLPIGAVPPECVTDFPDDNVSPPEPLHAPPPSGDFWAECAHGSWPMKEDCYVE